MAKKNNQPWMVASIVLGALLLVSLLLNTALVTVLFVGSSAPTGTTGDTQVPTQQPPTQGGVVEVSLDDDPVLGDEDAPVTIVEFADYECPFCGRYWQQTFPTIKEYIDNGDVKYVYRDFPLSFHPRAVPAAVAAECVDELAGDEAYYEMHDLIYGNQQALSDQNLRTYAVQVGVDGAAFDECYADEDGEMAAEVNADFRDGQQAGVSGTPTIFVNGKKIVGAQPTNVFTAAIEAELA